MAATTQINTLGRGPGVLQDVSVISVTVTANGASYATASGGLPFDLTTVIQTASAGAMQSGTAPNYIQTINVNDIVGIVATQLSTNKYWPGNFVVGTPVYANVPWQYDNGVSATPGILQANGLPCTLRLWGTGSGNAAAFAEVADGANTDVVTFLLYINRNGANN